MMLRPLALALALTSAALAQDAGEVLADWSPGAAGGALSRYISEGRDQLGAGGLAWSEATLGWRGLSLGASAARGTQVDYTEYNLWLGGAHTWERLTLGGSATQLWFPDDDADDQELAGSASYVLWGPLQLDGGLTYGFEAGGWFATVGLSCPLACGADGAATLTPFVLQSFDLGYASEAYDGPNNLEFGVQFSQPLGAGFCLEACAHYSCAQHDIRREGGGDAQWVSLGLRWTR